jgi:hypothetical protein
VSSDNYFSLQRQLDFPIAFPPWQKANDNYFSRSGRKSGLPG